LSRTEAGFAGTVPGLWLSHARALKERKRRAPKISEGEVVIRISGDTAIIHAATAFTTDTGASGRGRYTDIWQKQNGR
jgi:ketosteroid isomerase-like protein